MLFFHRCHTAQGADRSDGAFSRSGNGSSTELVVPTGREPVQKHVSLSSHTVSPGFKIWAAQLRCFARKLQMLFRGFDGLLMVPMANDI